MRWLSWLQPEVGRAGCIHIEVAKTFGLTVSLTKTKLMVTCCGIDDSDKALILVWDTVNKCVDQLPYHGSVVASTRRIYAEVDCCIAKASTSFGAMCQAMFKDWHLTVTTT